MNDKINGIIVDMKVYDVIDNILPCGCDLCCFYDIEDGCKANTRMRTICGAHQYFKFSQELTDKLNKQ